MSNIIRIKRKAAGGSTDGPSSLANAELAYNERTNILYYGWGTEGDNGTATQVVPIAGSGYVLDQIATNAPTKTGGGASGTWNISITGNAATVTNGVYTTGNQTISGVKTFSNRPIFNSGITSSEIFPNDEYIHLFAGRDVSSQIDISARETIVRYGYETSNPGRFACFDYDGRVPNNPLTVLEASSTVKIIGPNSASSGTYFPVWLSNPSSTATQIHSRTANEVKSDIGLGNVQNLALSAITFTAGNGLTGGGNLSANRTFDVGGGDGIVIGTTGVSVNNTVVRTTGNQIIQGSLTASGIFVSGANRAIGNISNDNLFLLTNNSARVIIANNGSVGIGQMPVPTFRLDVLGPTRMVGTTTFSSSGNSPNNIALNVNMISGGPDSTFSVTGDGNVFISGDISAYGNISTSGDISAYGNISTSGDLEANVITSEHLNSDSIDCHGSMSVGANQTIGGSLTVASGLTVNGTTTIINTTNLQVQDKNIELGQVNNPTNSTANGGGITLLGDTSKTIIWSDDNWTSSENWNIQSNKSYKINNVSVLTSASVGNTNTDWGGTIIPVAKGGTGASSLTGIVIGNGTGAMTAASGTANQLLRRNSTNTAYEFFTHNFGTVTSVVGTGTVSGLTLTGTVTTTGNLTLGGTLSTPVSTINDSTTVGQNLVKLANPGAIRFLRINANNTVNALTDSEFRTAIGAGTSSTVGTVTSVTAGSGMSFTSISTSGPVTLGTPSNITLSSTNSVTTNSHTHAFAPNGTNLQYIRGDGVLATLCDGIANCTIDGGTF